MGRKDKYRHQPWYIKLWRWRWYLKIPYWACKQWLYHRRLVTVGGNVFLLTFRVCWSISTDDANFCMRRGFYNRKEAAELDRKVRK